MGADFLYELIPACQVTPERDAQAKKLIETAEINEDMIACGECASARDRCMVAWDRYDGMPGFRDVAWLYLKGMQFQYIITGGMSWGDSPTESYEDMQALQAVDGLWGLLEDWATEDMQAAKKQ